MNSSSGFTLIELLLVVALVSILGATSVGFGQRFLVTTFLENKTNELVSLLRTSQLNSMSGKGDSTWGVNVTATQMTTFKGSSYAARDPVFDIVFAIPSTVSITQDEIVFDRVSGQPDATATFVLSSNAGTSRTVSVNAGGIVDVD